MYMHSFFQKSNFMRTKPLILVKKRAKLRAKSAMLNIRAKCIGFPFAILNQNIRTECGCRLYCIVCRLVYSLFYHILSSPVTDCTENKHYKRSFFLSDFLLYHTPISGIIDHYCIMGN